MEVRAEVRNRQRSNVMSLRKPIKKKQVLCPTSCLTELIVQPKDKAERKEVEGLGEVFENAEGDSYIKVSYPGGH